MRIAITGSSGFIGGALVRSLEADGHTAVRVVRSGGDEDAVRWDIERGEIDAAGLEGLDGVVHLAGEGVADKRWNDEQKRKILESRTQGTSLLAEALASLTSKPPVLLSGSGMDYYGDRGDEQLTEESTKGTGFLSDVVEAWESATAPAQAAGIRVAHLRTCMVLDGRGGALPRMLLPARFGLLGKMGSGKQWMSWISLADEVGAIRFLLQEEIAGPVNMGAPGPVTNEVFTKSLGRVLHRPTFVPVPSFAPKLLLGSELARSLLFESKRVLPDVLVDAGYEFRHPDLETTLRDVLDR